VSENVSSIPHAARSYDYLIGGDDYTPADQATVGRWMVEHFTPLAEFLGRPPGFITPADREGVNLEFYSALLRKD
jgi:hypothetical protein